MFFIETENLIIRNFQANDAADLYAYLHEPSASCFLSLALVDMNQAQEEAEKRGASDDYLAVCLRKSSTVIGDVFAVLEESHSGFDDTMSIGWNFNPLFGRRGYAFEAAKALTSSVFSKNNMRRVYAYVEEDNTPSRRICEKLGMRQEGLFKEFITFENDENGLPIYVNTMQFALLRKEWEAKLEAN